MIRIGGVPHGKPGEDTEFCGLLYPDGDEISKHMAARLQAEPFYQSDKLGQALALLKNRRVAIDCGAWVGGWSRELAKHFSRVIAIEAHPDNARCVARNCAPISAKGLFDVAVLNAALGEVQARVSLAREGNGPNVGTRVVQAGEISVRMYPLDDLDEVQALPFLDYIKVHVNGMELRALRGATETIRKHRPLLTVVLKPALETYGDTADAARVHLYDIGYRPVGGERPYELWAPRA